eukprot:PhF_6_TR26084/c0_g1_i2/m.36836
MISGKQLSPPRAPSERTPTKSTSGLSDLTTQLRETLHELTNLRDAQSRDLSQTQQAILERQQIIERSTRRIAELKGEAQLLEKEAEDLNVTAKEIQRRNHEEEQRKSAMMRRQSSKLDDARHARDEALSQLNDIHNQLETLTRSIQNKEAQLRVEVEELGIKATESKVKAQLLKSELDERDKELDMQKLIREHRIEEEVKNQIAERHAALAQIRMAAQQREADAMKDADAQVSSSLGALYKTRNTLQAVRDEKSMLETSIKDAESELDTLRADESSKTVLGRQISELEAIIAQQQSEALRAQSMASQLGEVLAQRNAALSSKRRCADRADEVTQNINSLESYLTQLRDAIAETTFEIEKVHKDTDIFQTNSEAERLARETSMSSLRENSKRLMDTATEQCSQWERQITSVTREIKDLQSYVHNVETQIVERRNGIDDLEKEMDALRQNEEARRMHAVNLLEHFMREVL